MNGYSFNLFHLKKIWLITSVVSLMSFSSFAQENCEERSIKLYSDLEDRLQFVFETTSEDVPNTEVLSQCITLVDVESELMASPTNSTQLSVNGGQFSSEPALVNNYDTVQLKSYAPSEPGQVKTTGLVLSQPTSEEQPNQWDYPWTVTTASSDVMSAQSCYEADFTFDERRQRLRVFELPAEKYKVPGETVTSQCIHVTNLPTPVIAKFQRDSEFSVNYGDYSREEKQIDNGDIIKIKNVAPNKLGNVLLDRLILQQGLEDGTVSTTYYQWYIGNRSDDAYTSISDCYVLTRDDTNTGILPHTVTSNDNISAKSTCMINAEPNSLLEVEPVQKNLTVFVNDTPFEGESVQLGYGDKIHLEHTFITPGFSYSWFNLKKTWDGEATSDSEVKWVIENNITSVDTPDTPVADSFTMEVTDDMFANCRLSSFHLRVNDTRYFQAAAFPDSLYQPLNHELASSCIEIEGLETELTISSYQGSWFSINGQPFTQQESILSNGDKLVLGTVTPEDYMQSKSVRVRVEPGEQARDSRNFFFNWGIQTINTERSPKTWRIGPSQEHRQIEDIMQMLVAGDVVEVIGDADYAPFIMENISGTPELPIKIVGVEVNGKKPRFVGNHSDWEWTVGLRSSHSIELHNVEITGGDSLCFRHESDNISIHDSFIHNCPSIGILGTDNNSGSLSIFNTEVTNSGGLASPDAKWGHPIYVATDHFRFPNSVLRVERSFLHNNRGNSVKSRAERTELYYNWIEVSDIEQSRYAIELIGPALRSLPYTDQDVVGNTIVMNKAFPMARFGNDGAGGSNGRVRFANNIILLNVPTFDTYLFNLSFELTSFNMQNNLVHPVNGTAEVTWLLRESMDLEGWFYEYPHIYIENNTFTNEMKLKANSLPNTVGNTSEYILGSERWNNNTYSQDVISTYSHNGLIEQIFGYQENTMPYLLNVPSYTLIDEYLADAPAASMILSRPASGQPNH